MTSAPPPSPSPTPAPLQLTSTAFAADGPIPREYTCKGADRSPDLAWTGVPPDAKALVLFVDDPDGGDWVHWSALDLDPSMTGLPAGVKPSADPPQQGTNDFGNVGYGGPCPPSGTHHYQFTLYALPAPLGLSGHPGGKAVRAALAKASPIDKVTLVGTFAH
jgi:Raf kinase inhibitor-like YbhB/YbcL family protein